MLQTGQNKPSTKGFYEPESGTISYIVSDPQTNICAIIDSVLEFNHASGLLSYDQADSMINYVSEQNLQLQWLIETHVHADHISAAPYIRQTLGGKIMISRDIAAVQEIFGKVFNVGTEFERDGSQFDCLLDDGNKYQIGNIHACAHHTPGHTPACMAHQIGDAIFVGDTLFMPDCGTARADFPGGDARTLYRSIQKILALPDETRIFVCHDYPPAGRETTWETTVGEQKHSNIHVGGNLTEDEFVAMREARDATLNVPKLIMPAIQVNMRAGHMPPAENNGKTYLKIPVSGLRQ